jgi:hypothetical protein
MLKITFSVLVALALSSFVALTMASEALAKPGPTPGAADPTDAGNDPGANVHGVCHGPAC